MKICSIEVGLTLVCVYVVCQCNFAAQKNVSEIDLGKKSIACFSGFLWKDTSAFVSRWQVSCVVCTPWCAGPEGEILKTSSENR